MMFRQQTEATTCPTIEPTSREGFSCTKESACKPGRGAPSGNKNAETHGYYRRKIKLEAVSFEDLNFSSSGGEQLPKRFLELLRWRTPCLCCPASYHRARCSSPNTSSIASICTLSSWGRGSSIDASAH